MSQVTAADNYRDHSLRDLGNDSENELRRLAEFGRVSAVLIHEISTPLTAASLTLEQLRKQSSDKLIKQAQKDLRQLERYVLAARQQLKAESRPVSFSLTVAIHQVVMILSARARAENVKILVNTIGKVRLYGDQVKLHQILANLINNAIDAFGHGSQNGSRLIKIQVTQKKGGVNISVSDNGKGIDKQSLEHIFDPFFSTKSSAGKGLGIGLFTVKKYLEEDFAGSIKAISPPEGGATFVIYLPLASSSTKGISKRDVVKIDRKQGKKSGH